MAGKFLLLEEAAKRLGVSADEIHRLVEKKKLFPLRDGATLKFKVDEIERLVAEAASEDVLQQEAGTDTFELDLDSFQPGSGVSASGVADSLIVAGSSAQAAGLSLSGSGSLAGDLQGASDAGDGSPQDNPRQVSSPIDEDDLAQTMLGSAGAVDALDGLELDLDSVVGISSAAGPSVSASAAKPGTPASSAVGGAAKDSGTLDIDLSGEAVGSQSGLGSGSNATGSLVLGSESLEAGPLGSGPLGSGPLGSDPLGLGPGGSDPAAPGLSGSLTNAGAALSGALDSGLSLEDDDAAVSGIDLGPIDAGQMAEDGATALAAGDEFDLGEGDDDSVPVMAAETGDSSFFTGDAGESSDFTGDLPAGSAIAADLGEMAVGEVVPDTRFSVWQISGLVCCTLLLLTGGFVMFDLMRTIGSPDDLTLSSPLLNPLSSVFGWR